MSEQLIFDYQGTTYECTPDDPGGIASVGAGGDLARVSSLRWFITVGDECRVMREVSEGELGSVDATAAFKHEVVAFVAPWTAVNERGETEFTDAALLSMPANLLRELNQDHAPIINDASNPVNRYPDRIIKAMNRRRMYW